MDTDLDTLATALYVTADDLLKAHPEQVPQRPEVGFVERISDAELIVLAVMQAFLGYTSEARWLRYAHRHLTGMFPYLPRQSGYNKRLRKLNGTMAWLAAELARHVPVASDDVWVVDSTPVECGRSRETAKRSDLAGWAEYGYCASHSRYFWGLRLHLVCTLHGLPLAWALTGAKANERDVVEHLLDSTAALQDRPTRRRQIIIADKGYSGREFETGLTEVGIDLLRPARKGEKPRPGQRFFKPLRQIIESVNDTLKGQLDLEAHGGRTPAGVAARVAQRILALTTAIWHNHQANSLARRNLVAYDH
ncbi:IS982 family transposase [Micropruina sp.]|uniref:IS982 family transposase n=1 Tax=Micropruina sp. TaxID=2737536 RepID=UPI0039E71E71